MVLEKHVSVMAVAKFTCYNIQYLRRPLRTSRLEGIKIGQVWLISLVSLEAYLERGQMVRDRRYGPRKTVADGGGGETI
jgi:hypothetical protein